MKLVSAPSRTSTVGMQRQHTHGCDYLRLHAVLVLEATGKVADAALAVARDVGHVADVVEHVSAGEEQDRDQADGGPYIPAPQDRGDVRPGDVGQGNRAGQEGGRGEPLHPVEGTLDGRVWPVGGVARNPSMDLLGALGAVVEVVAKRLSRGGGVRSHGGREEEEDGGGLEAELQAIESVLCRIRSCRVERTYRDKGFPAVREVQSAKGNARVALLVALGPAAAQQLPLWLELTA